MDYQLRSPSLELALEGVDHLHRFLADIPLEPLHEEWFRRRAWIRSVHGTTHIEGNTLNDQEVDDILSFGSGEYSVREMREVLGTRQALELVDELAGRADVLPDEAMIREIHRRVLDDINPVLRPGEYRRGENRVTDGEGTLIFSTPPSGDVPDLMQRFGVWLRDGADGHPAPVVAALGHLELVAIHPFYDGNGRTSRALSRFLLRRAGYEFRNIVSLDAQLDKDRTAYFAAIRQSIGRTYERHYDATAFVSYFLSALTRAGDFAIRRLHIFLSLLGSLKEDVRAGRLDARAIDPLSYLWVNIGIRPREYALLAGRTAQRATEDIRRLVEAGYLDPGTGRTRRRRHLSGPRLDELAERARRRVDDEGRAPAAPD